jgi:hypothetical protein
MQICVIRFVIFILFYSAIERLLQRNKGNLVLLNVAIGHKIFLVTFIFVLQNYSLVFLNLLAII